MRKCQKPKESPHSEHNIQKGFFNWLSYYPAIRRVSFAIPNGGSRNLITGKRLKAEGVTSGVPDCFIAIPMVHLNGINPVGYNGLFIEFKKAPNVLSFNQRVFIKHLRNNGYKCEVCYSVDQAIDVLRKYLGNLNGFGTASE